MTNRQKNNASRLSVALWQISGDASTVAQLARLLSYNVDQLKKDINDLDSLVSTATRHPEELLDDGE